MTDEQKEKRRSYRKQYLADNPFAHELYKKTKRKWRLKNKDKINQRRRERYAKDPEYREKVLHAPTKNGPDRKTTRALAYKTLMQDPAARARKRARDRRYRQSDACKAARKRYRMKIKTDPVRLENMRVTNRLSHRRNHEKRYLARIRKTLIPKWKVIAAEGPSAILAYWKKIKVKTRSFMIQWLRANGYPVPELPTQPYIPSTYECQISTILPIA